MMIGQSLGRRGVMRGAFVATACAAMMGTGRGGARALSLDPAKPGDLGLIYRKLAWSMDDAPGYWWLTGRRYALVDAALTPLWDMHIGMFFRARSVADGDRFDVTTISASFYTDIGSGAFLTEVANPFTGKLVTVDYYAPTLQTVRYDAKGRMDSGASAGGLVRTGTIGPGRIEGDRVMVDADYLVRRDGSPGAARIRVNDLSTYFGALRDVADPQVASAPAGQMFSDINTWPAWLGMGALPGSFYSRVLGYKIARYDQMPVRFRELMAQRYPDLAKDPAAPLGR